LLVLQDPLVEELLELLVAVIYAKLLEAVDFEIFYKTKIYSLRFLL